MNHLITGGAGFIGSHLADALVARGDRVVILDDLSTGRRQNIEHLVDDGRSPVELIDGSTSDSGLIDELMRSVDSCFHLASAVGVELVVDRPLDSLLRNVRGCDNVMGAAARHDVPLLFTSTSEVYGKNSEGALVEISDRLLGPSQVSRWGYANSKAFGEMLAFGYQREHGAEMVIVRLFNTVGPRQTGMYGMVVPRFVSQALTGEDLTVFGDGRQSRCFAHVADSVEAILLLAETDAAVGNVYNVGSPTEVTILELAQEVIERTESSSEIVFVPYEEAYGEGFEELGRRQPDTTALELATDWTQRFTIEQAIDDVIDYQRGLGEDELAAVRANGGTRVVQ
jgi:UDP-glucose 4-epimerase